MKYYVFLLIAMLFNFSKADMTKIAVIDTGFNNSVQASICDNVVYNFTTSTDTDTDGHGTNVSYLIHKNAGGSEYCQVPIKIFGDSYSLRNEITAMLYILSRDDISIVNYSGGGTTYNELERQIVIKLLDKGVLIVTAAGNESQNLDENCNFYPACYDKRIVVVGNLGENGKRLPSSNYGSVIDAWEIGIGCINRVCMIGTSQAAAIYSGKLIKNLKKKRKPTSASKILETTSAALDKKFHISSNIKKLYEKKLPDHLKSMVKYTLPVVDIINNKKITYKTEF